MNCQKDLYDGSGEVRGRGREVEGEMREGTLTSTEETLVSKLVMVTR